MSSIKKISINQGWKLIHKERSINIPAEVPGSVFEALINNGIIEDPFYGENEHKVSWVYDSDWEYQTEFDIEADFLHYTNIILSFYGLDTISEIFLNDKSLGTTKNMFIKYDFAVKTHLKEGNNKLRIFFRSPTKVANEEIQKNGINLNTGGAALPGVPYLRKSQYSFGWDWGPKLPDIGIWKQIELLGYNEIKIDSFYQTQTFKYNKNIAEIKNQDELNDIKVKFVEIKVDTLLDINEEDITQLKCKLKIDLKSPDGTLLSKNHSISSKNCSTRFQIDNPLLWWTHDLGSPDLYELKISLIKEEYIIDSLSHKIGIRDIQLIKDPDKWGSTFYFKLNGVPIFAKGGNWIPVDSFIPRGKKKGLYSMNLKYCKEANMNFIRIWGGGIYEDNLFYELCDELGLLVWQDFPFACAIYPSSEVYLDSVELEAIQNIKRIRNHSSLALWCGNNEIEQIAPLYYISQLKNPFLIKKFKKGYFELFEKLLLESVKKYDPNHSYWPSSPSNGSVKGKSGPLASNSPNSGDSHYWGVWHMGRKFQAYRKFNSRFMSEYGFESFPSMKTIATVCPPEQYDFYSPIMENHQKNFSGNKKIMNYMKKSFSIPNSFEKKVIVSQITQSEAMQYGIEHWRQNRNDYHCMGSLYWQINDCWQVASWSSLDYFGRWKALQYIAKRVYQPLFASVKEEKKSVELWITNDLRKSCKVTLNWKILNSESKLLMNGSKNVTILPCSSYKVETVDASIINKTKIKRQNNVIFFSLIDDNSGKSIYHGFRLFSNPKTFKLKDPKLSWEIERIYSKNKDKNQKENKERHEEGIEQSYQMKIKANSIALYVYLESDNFDFIASDNYFSLESGESRIIEFRIEPLGNKDEKIEEKEIIKTIKVGSLYNLMK